MNDIIDLLNLKDDNLIHESTIVSENVKTITLSKKCIAQYCPICNFKMHSRGITKRTVNHPILQDGYQLKLVLNQRRWRCTNPTCLHEFNDEFSFVEPGKRNTNLTELLILESFKDITVSATAIAKKFNVSDTYALETFDKYVNLKDLNFQKSYALMKCF